MTCARVMLSWLLVVFVAGAAAAQAPLTVGPVTAQAGTMASGELAVPARAGEAATVIPITVLNGARPGPVLALIAGVHGFEYPPVIALQRLRTAIDPQDLAGGIIMVHMTNMPSFLGRSIYYTPGDRKNLNRVFPGRADGTISERIADVITREVIDRAGFVVDLHCGDGNESLRPYLYWVTTGAPGVVEAGRQLALAFGMDHIVLDSSRPTDPTASVYLSNTAILRGKPALTIESGDMGEVDEVSIARIERGVAGVLRHLRMRSGGPAPASNPVWIGRNEVLTSGATGLWYPAVEKGHTVAEGALIGRVTDFFGRTLQEIRAPFAGEMLYVVGTPPVTRGEPVGFVGARATEAELQKR
ncbi:MAG: succinylglutamate desuccinylase/aspartoacylase family protein [Acidobacteria bacterium]|nr:succinylglutamate desuccinylase/aspartoacylase family protein [Acidobacteriota bacterium]